MDIFLLIVNKLLAMEGIHSFQVPLVPEIYPENICQKFAHYLATKHVEHRRRGKSAKKPRKEACCNRTKQVAFHSKRQSHLPVGVA